MGGVKIKILFALDPWIYRDSAGNQLYTLENIFIKAIKGLRQNGNDVRLLLGEDMKYTLDKRKINPGCKINIISMSELYSIYNNHYEAHSIQFNKLETKIQKDRMAGLIKKNLENWEPEVIISFTTPVSIWKYIYKNALGLQFENGIFSRAPYPHLCQLDPFGFLKKSYPAHFKKELRNNKITEDQKNRIDNLIKVYRKEIFEKKNPITRKELVHNKWKNIILIPLSYNGVIINDEASEFRSQLDFLVFILEKIPKETRILVTRHSLQLNGSIPLETETFLMNKYDNLSFCEELSKYAFLSQWLTPLVDGVITTNSTIGYHAALFNKKVFTIGDCEINSIATAENLDNIKEVMSDINKDDASLSVIYSLLTRHSFLLKRFWDGRWLTNRLNSLLIEYQNGNLEKDWKALPLICQDEDKIFEEIIANTPGLDKGYNPRIYQEDKK